MGIYTYLSPWTITSNSEAMIDFMLSWSSANSPERGKNYPIARNYTLNHFGTSRTKIARLQ